MIGSTKIRPLANIFTNRDIDSWPLMVLFIACVGLSHRRLNGDNISLYSGVIKKYDLNKEDILGVTKYLQSRKWNPEEIQAILSRPIDYSEEEEVIEGV